MGWWVFGENCRTLAHLADPGDACPWRTWRALSPAKSRHPAFCIWIVNDPPSDAPWHPQEQEQEQEQFRFFRYAQKRAQAPIARTREKRQQKTVFESRRKEKQGKWRLLATGSDSRPFYGEK